MSSSINDAVLAMLGSAIDFSVAHTVPVASVVPNPNQPRTEFNEDELRDLGLGMKKIGQKDAAFVMPQPDGRYLMISGERRWRALQKVGIAVIRVHFCRRELSSREIYFLSCYGNAQQVEQSAYDNVVMVRNLLTEKLSHGDIATLLSRSLSWVSQHAAVADRIDPSVLEMMRSERPLAERIILDEALRIVNMAPDVQVSAAQFMLANKKRGGTKEGQRAAFQVFVEQAGVRNARGQTAKRTVNGELMGIFSRFNRDTGSFAEVPEGMFVANLRQSGIAFLDDLLRHIDEGVRRTLYVRRALEAFPLLELAKTVEKAEGNAAHLRSLVERARASILEKQ